MEFGEERCCAHGAIDACGAVGVRLQTRSTDVAAARGAVAVLARPEADFARKPIISGRLARAARFTGCPLYIWDATACSARNAIRSVRADLSTFCTACTRTCACCGLVSRCAGRALLVSLGAVFALFTTSVFRQVRPGHGHLRDNNAD